MNVVLVKSPLIGKSHAFVTVTLSRDSSNNWQLLVKLVCLCNGMQGRDFPDASEDHELELSCDNSHNSPKFSGNF